MARRLPILAALWIATLQQAASFPRQGGSPGSDKTFRNGPLGDLTKSMIVKALRER